MPEGETRRALIVEPGRSRGALAGARALRLAGWEVGAAAPRDGLAASSRAVRWRHRVPDVAADPGAFVRSVDEACEQVGYDLVFGADDAEALVLAEHRDALRAQVPHAPAAAVAAAHDKLRLGELAAEAGLAVPASYAADDDLPDAPLVVKARLRHHSGERRTATELAPGRETARARAAELEAAGERPFLQRRVEGSLLSLAVVMDRAKRVVAAVQQRAERLFPPSSGMSARAETVDVDCDLVDRTGKLLAGLGWFGLAQLQFVAPADGEPLLIDLNGRFYGSMGLALAAGANLPGLWAGLAMGEPAPAQTVVARSGVHYQWLEGDFRRALVERRGGLAGDLLSVVRPTRRRVGAIWSARDPAPALLHTVRLITLAARRDR